MYLMCQVGHSGISECLAATRTADRVSSLNQNFWLDTPTPLIFLLEKAKELKLPV